MDGTTTTNPVAAAIREGDFRPAPGLEGITGRLGVSVAGTPIALLDVKDGQARFLPPGGDADATVKVDSEETVRAFQRGELNPIVAFLQGHLTVEGDRAFALRAALGLQVAHPFAQQGEEQGKGKGA
jgi:hypothetical protein